MNDLRKLRLKNVPTPLVVAACFVVGLFVGHGLGASSETNAKILKRLDRIERDLSGLDKVAAVEKAVEELAAADAAAASTRDESLARLDAQSETLAEIAEQTAALSAKVDGLGERTAALGAALVGVSSASVGASDDIAAGVESAVGALDESLTAEFDRLRDAVDVLATRIERFEAARAPAGGAGELIEGDVEAPETYQSHPEQFRVDLVEEFSPYDLALGVGQMGAADDVRLFLSRLDPTRADIVVVGAGKASVGLRGPSHRVDDTCNVALVGVRERRAFLRVTCS